jgi:adenylate cyclase
LSVEGLGGIIATPRGEMWAHDLQAAALQTVIEGSSPSRPWWSDVAEVATIVFVTLLVMILMPRLPIWAMALLLAITVGGVVQAGLMLWAQYSFLVDIYFVSFAALVLYGHGLFARFVKELLLKQQIKKQFGTYLSPAMVEKLQKNPDLLRLGGETRELSIMFTDVRGFTTISEHYGENVQGLTMIMNRYMTAMTAKILQNNGTLDKYIGDAQMAFWNAPLDNPNHAKDAVRTAVAMLDDLKRFNDEIAKEGVPPFGMGLGINTGSVVVGNMGSDQRFDYTCLGDSVNLAARLEGQSKPYGVKLVLGPKTASQVCDEFNVIELDLLAVKGKTEPVSIYTIVKSKETGSTALHKDFLRMYRRGQWTAAKALIKQLSTKFDGELVHYYEMMEERMQGKPPANFDGVYRATSK